MTTQTQNNVAKKVKTLLEAENEMIDTLPIEKHKMSNGKNLFYHDIFKVAKIILSNDKITHIWVYTFDNRNEKHW